jgi:hypothetical protein
VTVVDSDADPQPPTVRAAMDGWWLVDEYVETVFELVAASVRGHTAVYEDRTVVEAATAAGLPELPWRFLFVTRLEFSPPLVPGVGPAAIHGTVAREAASSFADTLRERGFERVERGRRERIRTDTGERARLTRFGAVYRPDDAATVDVEGWLAVWVHDGEFRLAGGAYPVDLAAVEGVDADRLDRARLREGLLDLIRAVA